MTRTGKLVVAGALVAAGVAYARHRRKPACATTSDCPTPSTGPGHGQICWASRCVDRANSSVTYAGDRPLQNFADWLAQLGADIQAAIGTGPITRPSQVDPDDDVSNAFTNT